MAVPGTVLPGKPSAAKAPRIKPGCSSWSWWDRRSILEDAPTPWWTWPPHSAVNITRWMKSGRNGKKPSGKHGKDRPDGLLRHRQEGRNSGMGAPVRRQQSRQRLGKPAQPFQRPCRHGASRESRQASWTPPPGSGRPSTTPWRKTWQKTSLCSTSTGPTSPRGRTFPAACTVPPPATGECASFARPSRDQRYIALMNGNDQERAVFLPLNFVNRNTAYRAIIFRGLPEKNDGRNAESREITSGASVPFIMRVKSSVIALPVPAAK